MTRRLNMPVILLGACFVCTLPKSWGQTTSNPVTPKSVSVNFDERKSILTQVTRIIATQEQLAQNTQSATRTDHATLSRQQGQLKERARKIPLNLPAAIDAMSRAIRDMGRIEDALNRSAVAVAKYYQPRALAYLYEVRFNLEEPFIQKRAEWQPKSMTDLVTRLQTIRSRQQVLTQRTKSRISQDGIVTRATLNWIANEELKLAEQTADTAELIRQEGSGVVFSSVLLDLAATAREVANTLRKPTVDVSVMQDLRRLTDDLTKCITALTPSVDSQAAQAKTRKPLVSRDAELRLLRSMQLRINEMTVSLRQAPTANEAVKTKLIQHQARMIELIELLTKSQ